MQPVNIVPTTTDRGARSAQCGRRGSDGGPARRQRDILQDRLSARLCRRLAAGPSTCRYRQEDLRHLKLHDIGNTVGAASRASRSSARPFLTVHAYPQTMKAAVGARAGSGLKILAVTVLTSYDDGDLHARRLSLGVSDLVEARASRRRCSASTAGARPRRRLPCARLSVTK